MALDRKTSVRIDYYDHEQQQIQSWALTGSARLALLVNTISFEKNKIETNEFIKQEIIDSAIQYITWDLKKFLETPYTTEDNA
jgi:hypothetical protein